ncbi:MAG: chorismate synthase [Verrucomicrobiaceae bacterium]|nr:chorismate synthase [Verrucomicrobiaceae bacterium]
MGNIFGKIFTVTTFGESHGKAVGCVIDGCPPMIELSEADIQVDLNRRRPGQSEISTQRNESDTCKILSGVYEGKTLGTPICILVENKDQHSFDYDEIATLWRPSHADFTYDAKFGIRDPRGGGRSSARETIGRVAAGAVAKKMLKGIKITAWVESLNLISMPAPTTTPTHDEIEQTSVRCPHKPTAEKMIEFIKKARSEGDSVGGVIRCRIEGLPAGLGNPVFDRFEAELAKAMLSLPATKGFEIGSGFAGTRMLGSRHNDIFVLDENGNLTTKTNNAGGVLGGITSSRPVDFRVAFKPTATIAKEQPTVSKKLEPTTVIGKGRHDPCVLPRAVSLVEAMSALVVADFTMRQRTIKEV